MQDYGRRKEEQCRKRVVIGGEKEGASVVVTVVEDVNRFNLSKRLLGQSNTRGLL